MGYSRDAGFTLIEALIAAALLTTAIAALAELLMRAADQSVRIERATAAAALAQAKLEELRAAEFAFDDTGARLTGAPLALSPENAHLVDAAGFVDVLGRFGELTPPEDNAMFRRRWSVVPLDGDVDTQVLTVCVALADTRASSTRPSCVWMIRTRQP